MKALHFGAGNIGRGFIGLILDSNGFELTFADVASELIDEIKAKGEYDVIMADESQKHIHIEGIKGINSRLELEELKKAIMDTNLITMAVGPTIVPLIAKSLVPGVKERLKRDQVIPFSIIACENAVGATDILKKALFEELNEKEIALAEEYIGFPNSAVDRIVPLQNNENLLDVKVEPFYEWVIEKNKIKGDLLNMEGVSYVDNLAPYIERKLFTLNTGHAATAYFGLKKGYDTVLEAITDKDIEDMVRGVLSETSLYITKQHGFSEDVHQAYVDKIIHRFKNPHISDDLLRVGRSPLRKISRYDRFVAPALGVINLGGEPIYLAKAIATAMTILNEEDPESVELIEYIKGHSVAEALEKYSSLKKNSILSKLVQKEYNSLNK